MFWGWTMIRWCYRLHPQDKASIFYTSKDGYFPDSVAQDSDGVCWIIEGKSEKERDDDTVQAKRYAAESLVRKLPRNKPTKTSTGDTSSRTKRTSHVPIHGKTSKH